MPLFGGPPSGRPGRNGSAPGGPVYPMPGAQPSGNEAQGYGLFAGSSGAHRAPSDTGGRRTAGPVPPPGARQRGDARRERNLSRQRDAPQRAGTEASGPSYQQAGRGAQAKCGRRGFVVAVRHGERPVRLAATPHSRRPVGPAPPDARPRRPGRRPAEQGGGDADPSPETTAFPVQHAPGAEPAVGAAARARRPGRHDGRLAGLARRRAARVRCRRPGRAPARPPRQPRRRSPRPAGRAAATSRRPGVTPNRSVGAA